MNKIKQVGFISEELKKAYEELKNGKYESKQLYKFISGTMDNLKQDPDYGTKIPKRLWLKKYIQNYGITNLWKCDLPGAWRLFYTIAEDEIKIVSVILDWMTHKDYERKFDY